jgi:hypothetical protein
MLVQIARCIMRNAKTSLTDCNHAKGKRKLENETMSNTENQTAETVEAIAEKSPVEKLVERFENRNKVFARVTDDQSAFMEFVNQHFDETNPIKDWASNATPKLGANFTLGAVTVEESGENRLIAIASKEALFGTGGDEVAKETAYRYLIGKALIMAGKPDATDDMFASVAGFLKAKFDVTAFKELAKYVVAVLHEKGLRSITVNSLKTSLQNAAFAKANYPTMTPDHWKIVFAIFISRAEKAGLDTSVFAHWQKTRDNMTDTGQNVEDFNFETFSAALDAETADEEAEEAAAETATA